MVDSVVIVGASLGGLRAAELLRRKGHAGRLTLVGDERELPYDRPPLSKQLLTGAWTEEQVALRRRDPAEVRAWRKANIGTLWLTGAAIVFLGTIPILNLIVPVLGVAAMVHIAQMLRPPLNLPTSPR